MKTYLFAYTLTVNNILVSVLFNSLCQWTGAFLDQLGNSGFV